MNRRQWMAGAVAVGVTMALNPEIAEAQAFGPSNPFFAPSTLPYGAPPFDRIHDADYAPALEAGLAQQRNEIDAIANSAEPTFENTLAAMERSGQLLSRVSLVFGAITQANTNPTLEKLQEDFAPKFAAMQDYIFLNAKLFARIERLYNKRQSLDLDAESTRLLEWNYEHFVLAGAKLSEADKDKLKKLNAEESTLSTSFNNRLLAAAKAGALTVSDKSKLAGLSAAEVEAAKAHKTDSYVLPLQNTTQQPQLASLTDRTTRQQLFEHSWMRAERGDANDTRDIIRRLAQVRAQKAGLLGFPNYAAYTLQDQMAKTPENARRFLDALVKPAVSKAKAEAADIQQQIDASGQHFELQPWDWELYSERVRKAKYDLNLEELKPYFEIHRVLEDGVFYAANQLYGITFKQRHDLPVYQPEVITYEVFDVDSKPLALMYFDYWKRDNKNGGAWMSNFVNQSTLLRSRPVIYNVANFQKPAPGQPALISFDDVTTMFHEFGHALHGMFADTVYPSLSGTATARDFVEFPSQFNEHWATDPKVFHHFALHHETKQPMPDELFAKLMRAQTFNKGYATLEALAAQQLDLEWHTLPPSTPLQDVDAFEKAALQKTGVAFAPVPPRYRSSYFLHIWANGYAAGYYAYAWAEMLDDDAFQWFTEHGGLTRENGERFRKMVLSRGNTEDLETMYERWAGRKPGVEPLLHQRGLVADSAAS